LPDLRYNRGARNIADGFITLSSDGGLAGDSTATTFGILLVSTDYFDLANIENFDFVADGTTTSTTSYEPSSSSSYVRQTLGAVTVAEVDASNRVDIDAPNITFTAVSSGAGIIGGAIIFASASSEGIGIANASSSIAGVLLSAYSSDSGFPVTPNGGDIALNLSTGGFLQFTT